MTKKKTRDRLARKLMFVGLPSLTLVAGTLSAKGQSQPSSERDVPLNAHAGEPLSALTGCYDLAKVGPLAPVPRPVTTAGRFVGGEHPFKEAALEGLTVALDAGHGGDAHPDVVGGWEPGATSPFFQDVFQVSDFIFNYEESEDVANRLRALGAKVELYRYPEPGGYGYTTLAKGQRARGADVYISLHHNSSVNPAQGSEVFTLRDPERLDTLLAYAIQDELVAQVWDGNQRYDRGVKSANFEMLRGAAQSKVPAVVLVESFFIHNNEALQTMVSRRKKAAKAIADGVANYWLSN